VFMLGKTTLQETRGISRDELVTIVNGSDRWQACDVTRVTIPKVTSTSGAKSCT
jgi:hypothetical protein